jgi:hypothetical protein
MLIGTVQTPIEQGQNRDLAVKPVANISGRTTSRDTRSSAVPRKPKLPVESKGEGFRQAVVSTHLIRDESMNKVTSWSGLTAQSV